LFSPDKYVCAFFFIGHPTIQSTPIRLPPSIQLATVDPSQPQSAHKRKNGALSSPLFATSSSFLSSPSNVGVSPQNQTNADANMGLKSTPSGSLGPHPAGLATTQSPTATETREFSRAFRDFIACALQRDPAKRWTAVQLLRHAFITGQPFHPRRRRRHGQSDESAAGDSGSASGRGNNDDDDDDDDADDLDDDGAVDDNDCKQVDASSGVADDGRGWAAEEAESREFWPLVQQVPFNSRSDRALGV
jgi:serine/threonine protein kinase